MGKYLESITKSFSEASLKIQGCERGQDLAEYAMLLGLIALIVIAAVVLLGENISTVFSQLASGLPF